MTETKPMKCLGIPFTMTGDYRFAVEVGDEGDREQHDFNSYTEMQRWLENWQKADNAQKRRRVSIDCFSVRTCKRHVLTGVNAGNGRMLTSPKMSYELEPVVPAVGWVPAAVAKLKSLRQQASHLETALNKLSISPQRWGYGVAGSASAAAVHERSIKQIEGLHAEALKTIEASDFEAWLAKQPKIKVGDDDE